MRPLIEQLEALAPRAHFISADYTSKSRGERARYTLRMGNSYRNLCLNSLTEIEIRLKDAVGIERMALLWYRQSIQESIKAMDEGRYHINNKKAGLYRGICPGVKVALNDLTCEIQGVLHAYKPLEAGDPIMPVNHRNALNAAKAKLRPQLPIGKWVTLCLEFPHMGIIKLNGDTLELFF